MRILVKIVHTIVWAFFVACIAGIYAFAAAGRFRAAGVMAGIVAVEVAVLMLNGMKCPLTPLAARYTDEHAPNFDIYLPRWLAKYNKEIFGTLYLGGVAYALALWAAAR
jgi:hypothetical protein